MKRILILIVSSVIVSMFYTSCKTSDLDTLRDNELAALDEYVADNNLTNMKDVSGIYIKHLVVGTGDTIKSGYKAQLYFNITLLDGTVVFSTEDAEGRNYEEYSFYVDVSNDIVNQQYVQQISGLHIALKKMRVGGRALVVIPSEHAFKALDNTMTIGIPRFSTLLATVFVKKAYSPEQQK